jgi:hypothetical protein
MFTVSAFPKVSKITFDSSSCMTTEVTEEPEASAAASAGPVESLRMDFETKNKQRRR